MTKAIAINSSADNLSPSIQLWVTPVNTNPRMSANPFRVAPACLCTNAVNIPPNALTATGIIDNGVQYLKIPLSSFNDFRPSLVATKDISRLILEYNPSSIVYKYGFRPFPPAICTPFWESAPANPEINAAAKQGTMPLEKLVCGRVCSITCFVPSAPPSFFPDLHWNKPDIEIEPWNNMAENSNTVRATIWTALCVFPMRRKHHRAADNVFVWFRPLNVTWYKEIEEWGFDAQ